jgi:hypothetical protein
MAQVAKIRDLRRLCPTAMLASAAIASVLF